jgi:hypothetical protein
MKRRGVVLGAVTLALASGRAVVGQELRAQDVNTRAEQLKQAAEALYAQPHRMRSAAALHEQEAAQRAAADPRRVEALERAARLYAYAGDAERARTVMERAARRALERGDVARAAHAFIDAAFFALKEGDRRLADELTREADLLATSPLLSAGEKAAIVRRIDPTRLPAVVFEQQ